MQNNQTFNRTLRLTGTQGFDALQRTHVIIFGVGGVGSWAAEALARSGVGHITMVDPDIVAQSNINRQLPALHSTIGMPKVEVMRARLTDINPDIDIVARQEQYSADTAEAFDLDEYDYVIDAIDSVADKALLLINACRSKATLYSSMGAALKIDPLRVETADFSKVKGCKLAAALRNRFKRDGVWPRKKFKCVFSQELRPNRPTDDDLSGAMTFNKKVTNGAMVTVTATFGLTLASLVIDKILRMSV